MSRQQYLAYAFVATAATLWGSMGVLAKMLYASEVSPWSVIFYRCAMGFLGCGLVMLLADRSLFRMQRQDLPFLAIYGLVSTSAFFALYLYTISLTTVATAVVLLYTAPVFATLWGRLVYGEAITGLKMVALTLSFAGCTLVAGLYSGDATVGVLGIATGLGSAITYSLFGIMGKHARRLYNPWTILFYSMGFATVFLVPVLGLPGASLGPYPEHVWALLAAIGVGPTLLSRVLYVTAVKHVEVSRAAIVATVEPLAAAIFAFLILGETLSPSQMMGGFLVLAGSVLAQQRSR